MKNNSIKGRVILFSIVTIVIVIITISIIILLSKGTSNIKGNLKNCGLVVEEGNTIYYLGFGDFSGIYKSKNNGIASEKIVDEECAWLNVEGEYIYYVNLDEYSICKIDTNGKNKTTIVKDIDANIEYDLPIQVKDGWIYYSKDGMFYRIKTDGRSEEIIEEEVVESYHIVDEWVYYTYMDYTKEKSVRKYFKNEVKWKWKRKNISKRKDTF